MTEDERGRLTDPPPPDDAPPTLDYRRPTDEWPAGVSAVQVIATALMIAVVLTPAVFFGVALLDGGGRIQGLLLILMPVGLTAIVAYRLRASPRTRGVSMGLWLGLGLAALLEGVCFGFGILRLGFGRGTPSIHARQWGRGGL